MSSDFIPIERASICMASDLAEFILANPGKMIFVLCSKADTPELVADLTKYSFRAVEPDVVSIAQFEISWRSQIRVNGCVIAAMISTALIICYSRDFLLGSTPLGKRFFNYGLMRGIMLAMEKLHNIEELESRGPLG